jgi:hypothetical protein
VIKFSYQTNNSLEKELRNKISKEIEQLPFFSDPECCKLTNKVLIQSILKITKGEYV